MIKNTYPIEFYINEKRFTVEVNTGTRAIEVIKQLGYTGTKTGCNEGDCGACTIAMAPLGCNQFKAVASCILAATKLNGMQIVTIEGLGNTKKLHLIQKSVRDYYGVQCGFCTPGVIISLFCLFSNNPYPEMKEIEIALQGNICRCTGYEGIRNAATKIIEQLKDHNSEEIRKLILPKFLDRKSKDKIPILNRLYSVPENMKELDKCLKQNVDWLITAGGTDTFIEQEMGRKSYKHVPDVSKIDSFKIINTNKEYLEIGGAVTISEARDSETVANVMPFFKDYASHIASTQIRNVGTLSGNLLTASPIADISVLLLALGSKVELYDGENYRVIKVSELIVGYRKTIIKKKEVLTKILIPLRIKEAKVFVNKTSKRKSDDISTVNSISCIYDNRWVVAINGISSKIEYIDNIYRIVDTSNMESFTKGVTKLANDYNPITDIRGSKDFRQLLIKNHLIKDYLKLKGEYDG